MLPPCSSTIPRAIASPRPRPTNRPVVDVRAPVEALEHVRQVLSGYPDSRVTHGEVRLPSLRPHREANLAPVRRVLHRVLQQVVYHLRQPASIPEDRDRPRGPHRDRVAFRSVPLGGLGGQPGQVDLLLLSAEPHMPVGRGVEELADERVHPLRLAEEAPNPGEIGRGVGVSKGTQLEELCLGDERRQRRPEVVSGGREEVLFEAGWPPRAPGPSPPPLTGLDSRARSPPARRGAG